MAHNTAQKKYINLLLIPDDESTTRKFRIRYSFLISGGILVILLLVLLLIVAVSYSTLLNRSYENVRLKEERTRLLEQVQRINHLTQEVELLKTMREQVQKNLTGYVSMANDADASQNNAEKKNFSEQSMSSIFNSIPVKAPVRGFISQEFAPPKHNGVDVVASEGTPVLASAKGRVLFSDWSLDGGYTVIIGHDEGYISYYKHNQKNVVQINQQVERGELIGYLGNSGLKSDGPHLHFEIWKDGIPINPKLLVQNLTAASTN